MLDQLPLSGSLKTDPTSLFLRNPDVQGVVAIPNNLVCDEVNERSCEKIRAVKHGKRSSLDVKYSDGKVRMKVTDWATESRQLSHLLGDDKNIKRRRSSTRRSKSSAASSTSFSSSASSGDFEI